MKALLFAMPDIYPRWTPLHIMGPNLALASIAGNCPRHEVFVGDLILKRKNIKKAVRQAIEKYSPAMIGLSAMTFQFPTLVKIAAYIRETYPEITLAVGGYHATVFYKEICDEANSKLFDFMFRGESDLSFNELLNELQSGRNFSRINGLSFKENGHWIHNPARQLENLDDIRLPDRNSRIWKGYHFLSEKYDTIETSRGCLNYCKFCSIRQMYGHSRREYPISRVIEDIKNAKARGTRYLFFVDDNLTSDIGGMERFEKLLDAIIENKLNDMRFATQASSTGMGADERIVKKMRKAGFDFVFLGMENISPKNLAYYKKGNIVNYTKRAVEYLRRNGIIVMGGLVQGMEDDTEEDFKLNCDYLIESKVDNIMSQILTPYPGTELREELIEKNLVTNFNDWPTYSGYFANVKTNNLSTEDLNFLQWKYSSKYYTWRTANALGLNVFKNHPWHCVKTALIEGFRNVPKSIRKIGKNEREKFKIDFEEQNSLNRNLI